MIFRENPKYNTIKSFLLHKIRTEKILCHIEYITFVLKISWSFQKTAQRLNDSFCKGEQEKGRIIMNDDPAFKGWRKNLF